jgi:hypothetical protein
MMPNEPSSAKLGKSVGDKLEEQYEHMKSGINDLAVKAGVRDKDKKENRTKEQLYADAKRLGVKGRSKMTKDQLAKAVGKR